MDQPGRCRRTDGKRWRCTKDAIPNEKYCQTHMHRGCRRSRKLVESSIADLNLRLKMQQPSADATTDKTANDAVLKIDHSSEDPCSRMTKIPASKMEGKQLLPSAEGKERLKIEANNKVHTISLEFSPKSVLGQGELAEETKRCRRTDGKRWRCSKEVIGEDQKYCASHMYRGAKKRPHSQQRGEECNPFALVKRADKLMLGFDNNLASSS